MSERLTGAQLAEILKATTNLECATEVVQLITEYERRPVEDPEMAATVAILQGRVSVAIERDEEAETLIVSLGEASELLDALSDSKREIERMNATCDSNLSTFVAMDELHNETIADLKREIGELKDELLTVTNELEGSQAQFKSHTEHVGQFLNGMYATMIDPLADEPRKVADTCELLLKAAQQQRQKIEDLTNELEGERKRWLLVDRALQKLEGIANAWRNRSTYGQGTAAFLQVDSAFSDIREAAEACALLNAAVYPVAGEAPE